MTRRLIALVAAMGILYVLTAWAQKLHSPQQLVVYDAEGKKVGVVAGGQDEFGGFKPLVPFRIDEVPILLGVFRDGFVGQTETAWESTNCTGQPFVTIKTPGDFRPPRSLPVIAVGIPGNTVYVEDGTARTIAIRSYSTMFSKAPGDPPHQCATPGIVPWTMVAVPARPLIDMDTYFKPPFTVR